MKNNWPIISQIIEIDKAQGTTCRNPQSNLTFFVQGICSLSFTKELIESFLWDLGGC